MDKVAIISIIYNEPDWSETERCIDAYEVPKFFVDRHGVGSLAKAINSGFHQWGRGFEFIWFVTNVTFSPNCLSPLMDEMQQVDWAAITPCFQSDHLFCRPGPGRVGTASVPFVEFTAPLVRSSVFEKFPLDEDMPYWGHDLDWGYRVRKAGHPLGCCYGAALEHQYIRNSDQTNFWTAKRWAQRKATNASTRQALIKKYGSDWKRIVQWRA